jgi:hypothetical protein
LQEFTARCDVATGIHVPDFNCSAGTLVPTTNFSGGVYPSGFCDRPNRLNLACDPGSRFQVIAKNNDAVAVAHCRKTGLPGNLYSDIAIIQYNKANGAVCYYQALNRAGMDGNFKSPAFGTSLASESNSPNPSASPWRSNATTKGIDCRQCHDNGAFIRSPYLAQIASGPNALPGAGDFTYNKTNPVSFIGEDYQGWRLYSVQAVNVCTACHRMGVSNSPQMTVGTARDLGIRATAVSETNKNMHGPDSPIWMTPTAGTWNADNANAAAFMKLCAQEFAAGLALPAGCSISEITTSFRGLSPASALAAIRSL